jgi:thiol-disulfide isomerase/thioredoxin
MTHHDLRADTPSLIGRISASLRRPRTWIELAVFVTLFAGVRAWQRRDLVQGVAPRLEGHSITGAPLSLAHDGRPTVVHFWATWCGVCDAMDGQVASVAEDHRVLTVATRSGAPDAIAGAMREDGLMPNGAPAFDVIADEDGALARAWGVTTLPTTFVVDGDGTVRSTEVGFTSSLGMRARLWFAD